MAKVQREMITVSASYYNFDETYEKKMAHLDDESIRIINVHPVSLVEEDGLIQEKYLVFYQEIEVAETEKMPRYGRYEGKAKNLFRLHELSDLEWNTPISIVTIDRNIIFEEMKLTPGQIVEDLTYWEALEEKEGGTLQFVVDEKTL